MTSRRDLLKAGARCRRDGVGADARLCRRADAVDGRRFRRAARQLRLPCPCRSDMARFPMAGRVYTPPAATAKELLGLQECAAHRPRRHRAHPASMAGQPRDAGRDAQLGPQRARGIAVIDQKTTDAELDDLERAGIRGVRVNLETAGRVRSGCLGQKAQMRSTGRSRTRLARPDLCPALRNRRAEDHSRAPCRVVFDHFGGARAGSARTARLRRRCSGWCNPARRT